MRKVLLGLFFVLLLLAVFGTTAAAQASTLLSDDYEGAVKWNASSSGWAVSTTRVYRGTFSAHAPSANNNLMIYGPFDLSTATAATLSFRLWYSAPRASYPPGTPNTAGSFLGGYSLNGSSYTFPYQWSGSTAGEWWTTDFDLGGWSLLGQPQVWIALGTSVLPGALYSEGAYVDDLTLTATVPDTTPPVTTATGWDAKWHRAQVTVSLAATDNAGGSGVASTDYSTDGGSTWTPGVSVVVAAPVDHSSDGLHTISYRSLDVSGNTETPKSCTVRIDTRKPTPKAPYAASAARGRTAALRYNVTDPRPGSPTATVTIKIRNRAGALMKTLKLGAKTVNKLLTASFTVPRTWRAGTYRFSVSATDQAGNAQSKVAVNSLFVR